MLLHGFLYLTLKVLIRNLLNLFQGSIQVFLGSTKLFFNMLCSFTRLLTHNYILLELITRIPRRDSFTVLTLINMITPTKMFDATFFTDFWCKLYILVVTAKSIILYFPAPIIGFH